MKLIYKNIPNSLTSLNIVSGFIAIVLAFNINYLAYSAYFIFIAACFDFMDGLAARLLDAYSEFGKQLDSLADAISFGVAPGVIAFQLLQFSSENVTNHENIYLYLLLTASIIPLFSVFRLAKFNIDNRQSHAFRGLPTPASAILIASLALIVINNHNDLITKWLLNTYFLVFIIICDALLMISDLPMFSLKIKSLTIKDNLVQYIFMSIAVILLIWLQFDAIPIIIGLYIIMSLIVWVNQKITNTI